MRLLLLSVLLFLLPACTLGKGYLLDTDAKCRVLTYGEGGSGMVSQPFGTITMHGPASYHVVGDGCQGMPMHPPEENP